MSKANFKHMTKTNSRGPKNFKALVFQVFNFLINFLSINVESAMTNETTGDLLRFFLSLDDKSDSTIIVSKDKLSMIHALFLTFPTTIMNAHRYVLNGLSLDQNWTEAFTREEDIIANSQGSYEVWEFNHIQFAAPCNKDVQTTLY